MPKFEVEKKTTIIDNDTGAVAKLKEGVVKGFAEGFKNYVAKGPKHAEVEIAVDIGQFPATRAEHGGKYGIHITIYPFDEEEDAATIADRAAALLRKSVGGLS